MSVVSGLFSTAGVFTSTAGYLKSARRADAVIANLKGAWAHEVLSRLNVQTYIIGRPDTTTQPLLFVGNHISYLDIPILMSTVPSLSFVAKNEVASWPVFGAAARKIDTIFVKRGSGASRENAKLAIVEALNERKRVVVFPSGTTCVNESKPWRYGAFQIAQLANCQIQPFRLTYTPLRRAAYIDRDFFPWHMVQLATEPSIQAYLEFHPPVSVQDIGEDAKYWQNWSRGLIETQLFKS